MAEIGADMLVERRINWGVDTIFSLPGDGSNGIDEAISLEVSCCDQPCRALRGTLQGT